MSAVPSLPCSYADEQAPTFVEIYDTNSSYYAFEYHSHANADWEIQYMARGRSTICLEDRPYGLGTGEILLLGPGQRHSCAASLGQRLALTFREDSLAALPFEARPEGVGALRVEGRHLPARLSVPPQVRVQLTTVLAQLEVESTAGDPMARAMCSMLLGQILLVLAREAHEADCAPEVAASPYAQQTVERLCQELRGKLDYPWTLAEMVRRSGYSAPQLHRLFDQVTSLSPCRWLREERLRSARRLLVETDMVMSRIAVEVGFQSRCQFHRVFRQATGTSPEQYRQTMRPSTFGAELQHH